MTLLGGSVRNELEHELEIHNTKRIQKENKRKQKLVRLSMRKRIKPENKIKKRKQENKINNK